ncbi:Uncharacterised protein (plasmid) [Mesomycoplasma conjunctivae]|uniref:Uncharacterized protein n=1 Tax=Mycoplasmopsis fermentans (strain M64) TaxID=943945 RepID=A0AB32XCW7_MYCFM|nr:hypothetical protein [Mycoplasmopsis fermentans]ADV34769.1 Hypothetical Protein MfeM64YM_0772 [Mycoplasmopsis fermentans M64]VEU63768.1 Uncharacterised protein [Mycoplasmopsis fermentans]VEU67242.1 Uncharacterised protein [Mesomycoplasma conjunctivae]
MEKFEANLEFYNNFSDCLNFIDSLTNVFPKDNTFYKKTYFTVNNDNLFYMQNSNLYKIILNKRHLENMNTWHENNKLNFLINRMKNIMLYLVNNKLTTYNSQYIFREKDKRYIFEKSSLNEILNKNLNANTGQIITWIDFNNPLLIEKETANSFDFLVFDNNGNILKNNDYFLQNLEYDKLIISISKNNLINNKKIQIIVEFLNKEKYIKGVFRTNYNFDDSDYEYHFVISRSKSDFLLLANIDHNNNDSKKLINSFNEMLDLNIENKLQFFIDEFRKTTDDKILKFVVIKKMSKKKNS